MSFGYHRGTLMPGEMPKGWMTSAVLTSFWIFLLQCHYIQLPFTINMYSHFTNHDGVHAFDYFWWHGLCNINILLQCIFFSRGNSLWPNDTIWQNRLGTTFDEVMDGCLSQCWIIIGEVLWHPHESNIRESTQSTMLCNEFKSLTLQLTSTPSQGPMSQYMV